MIAFGSTREQKAVIMENWENISESNGHGRCLLCGAHNPLSLKMAFRADGEGVVRACFKPHSGLQGYDGILHGGVISALLDAAMTHCLFHRGVRAVTGDLRVRFMQPVPCHGELDLRAWLLTSRPPLFRLKAEAVRENRIMAWAEAKFMEQKPARGDIQPAEAVSPIHDRSFG